MFRNWRTIRSISTRVATLLLSKRAKNFHGNISRAGNGKCWRMRRRTEEWGEERRIELTREKGF